LAGIVAIIGAISVYIKMNNEEQDVKKSIMMIVGACIFLIAAAQRLTYRLFLCYTGCKDTCNSP
jgi:type IV secretory pathway VirB2 component (pilin)